MADIDFDTKAAALLRRRKMADLLQQQSLEGFKPPPIQGRTSILEPLGQMAKAFAGMQMGKEVDTDEAANEAARTAEYNRLLAEMPKGTAATPGTPEMGPPSIPEMEGPNSMGPPALLPASGFQPAIPGMPAAPPTGAEMLPWAAKIARTGPQGRDLAKFVEQRSMENMLPKAMSPYEIANLESQAKDRDEKREERRVNNMATLAQREAELRARIEQGNLDRDAKAQLQKQHDEVLLALKRSGATRSGDGKLKDYDRVGMNGEELVIGEDGVRHARLPDGTVDPKPYAGQTQKRLDLDKSLVAIKKAAGGHMEMQGLADEAEKNQNAFTTKAKAEDSTLLKLTGLSDKISGLTKDERNYRTQVFAKLGEVKHSLYGASFTDTERTEAARHIPTAEDNWMQVRDKLEGRARLEARVLARLTPAERAKAKAMGIKLPDEGAGGAAPGAAAPGGGDGWGPVTPARQ